MRRPLVLIVCRPPGDDDPPLTRILTGARDALVRHQQRLFLRAGGRVAVLPGHAPTGPSTGSFGELVATVAAHERPRDGLVVLGAGAVPLLRPRDIARLLKVARSGDRAAITNNRHSSDICAVGRVGDLRHLPAIPSDNALPRWLEERAGYRVTELPGRDRLALDLDTPLDLALLRLVPGTPAVLRDAAHAADLVIPRLDALRSLAADARRELLVAGRSGSGTLRWLERSVRCRVRFLAEERGLRASTSLALGDNADRAAPLRVARPPRGALGRLLDLRGPGALGEVVGELADGAVLDSRVLLADRLGADERTWPSAEDRFAADLLAPAGVADDWLRQLTLAAVGAPIPILMGGHTLVGPGLRWLLHDHRGPARPPGTRTLLR